MESASGRESEEARMGKLAYKEMLKTKKKEYRVRAKKRKAEAKKRDAEKAAGATALPTITEVI